MNKRNIKSIRTLEHNAKEGSIKALFQLAENHKKGQSVDQNDELADSYYKKTLNVLKKHKFQITSIQLIDFRVFKNCKIDFCTQDKCGSNLTVIIGNNGAGKTTIVDAIAYSLSWFTQRIVRKEGNGDLIDKNNDVHINSNKELSEYASILTKIELSEIFDMELSIAKDGGNALRRNYMTEITQLADIYKYANSQDSLFNLPIMAVYSAERALDVSKNDLKPFDEVSDIGLANKFEAYNKGAFNGKADFKLFFRWFKKIKDNYNALVAEAIEASNSSKVNDELTSNIYSKSIDHVLKAISLCMPSFSNLRIQRQPTLDMLVDKDEVTLSVLQLSQGEKTLMALIADIVRRLILLNPSLDEPLKGSGIVLIDEIDLHLHPKWQQLIVPNLLITFPNIQFIVTTHSPQVLSTVEKKCIRVLGVNNDGEKIAKPPLAESYGEPSNDVLQAIMGVDPQPPVPEKVLLDELTSLVEQNSYDPPRIQKLLKHLKETLNNKHPQILKIERSIRRKEMLKG